MVLSCGQRKGCVRTAGCLSMHLGENAGIPLSSFELRTGEELSAVGILSIVVPSKLNAKRAETCGAGRLQTGKDACSHEVACTPSSQ
mmetsp:Transcript_85959/g.195986  ORF Transcript_85959/g.195986 Transcript_85959/m.195986 type:complete len:87 (+) Transcript_85959:682-942(+)